MDYKFKIGDNVRIINSGYGYTSGCIGEIVTILKLGIYDKGPGYKTTIPSQGSSNVSNDSYNSMAGEKSFELENGNNISYEIY